MKYDEICFQCDFAKNNILKLKPRSAPTRLIKLFTSLGFKVVVDWMKDEEAVKIADEIIKEGGPVINVYKKYI